MKVTINKTMETYYRKAFDKIFADYAYKGTKDVPQKMVDSDDYVMAITSLVSDIARMIILNEKGTTVDFKLSESPDAFSFEDCVKAIGGAIISLDQNRSSKDKEFPADTRIPEDWVFQYERAMAIGMVNNGVINEKLFNNPDKFNKKMGGLVKSFNNSYWKQTAQANQSRTGLLGMIQKGVAKSGSKKENPSPADNLLINSFAPMIVDEYGRQLAPIIYKTFIK